MHHSANCTEPLPTPHNTQHLSTQKLPKLAKLRPDSSDPTPKKPAKPRSEHFLHMTAIASTSSSSFAPRNVVVPEHKTQILPLAVLLALPSTKNRVPPSLSLSLSLLTLIALSTHVVGWWFGEVALQCLARSGLSHLEVRLISSSWTCCQAGRVTSHVHPSRALRGGEMPASSASGPSLFRSAQLAGLL
jgi:hypothetical protein